MKVVFLQATVKITLEMRDDEGRPVAIIAPQEPWVVFYKDLPDLLAKVQQYEAAATAKSEVEEREAALAAKKKKKRGG